MVESRPVLSATVSQPSKEPLGFSLCILTSEVIKVLILEGQGLGTKARALARLGKSLTCELSSKLLICEFLSDIRKEKEEEEIDGIAVWHHWLSILHQHSHKVASKQQKRVSYLKK